MNDMKEVVNKKIDDLHREIKERTARLQKTVERVREFVNTADSYDIVTFLPREIREIEWERRRIEELEAQARMLVWMVKEAQE